MTRVYSGATRAEVALKAHKFTGQGTRTAVEGSGDEVITGVGFRPRLVILIAFCNQGVGHATISWGFDDGTTHYCINIEGAAGGAAFTALDSIELTQAVGATWTADITAFSDDGFTLTFVLVGAPGDCQFIFTCFD